MTTARRDNTFQPQTDVTNARFLALDLMNQVSAPTRFFMFGSSPSDTKEEGKVHSKPSSIHVRVFRPHHRSVRHCLFWEYSVAVRHLPLRCVLCNTIRTYVYLLYLNWVGR
ncbi:hypothetical protein LZ31DRAFT_45973 [Colletotrichum somersetense]|nr:hypothetical protein LZ31DRAFT_45973 [Colletotrichum somersetense]